MNIGNTFSALSFLALRPRPDANEKVKEKEQDLLTGFKNLKGWEPLQYRTALQHQI